MQGFAFVMSVGVLALALTVTSGCATSKRAAQLVVDHHIGMARSALDIINGEAEAREQRVAKLRAEIDANSTALAAEQDRDRLVDLLKQHVTLQDALVAELLQGNGHHGGHQQAQADTTSEQTTPHEH
jgi:hypothetical protein